MKKIKVLIMMLALGLILLSCGSQTDSEANKETVKEISSAESIDSASSDADDSSTSADSNNNHDSSDKNDASNSSEDVLDSGSNNDSSSGDSTNDNKKSKASNSQSSSSAETIYLDSNSNFYSMEITEDSDVFARMNGKSYSFDCTVALSDLRYLHVLYMGFDGNTHDGEIVCNKYIAEDLLEIFAELYSNSYPIERIQLVDDYNADDEASMQANNTSCFNFRFISGTKKVSKHGYGLAIDINTLYNPYVKVKSDGSIYIQPSTAGAYVDRSQVFPYKIDETDLAYRLFTEHGFIWGGSWNSVKDYQHFEVTDSVVSSLYP